MEQKKEDPDEKTVGIDPESLWIIDNVGVKLCIDGRTDSTFGIIVEGVSKAVEVWLGNNNIAFTLLPISYLPLEKKELPTLED